VDFEEVKLLEKGSWIKCNVEEILNLRRESIYMIFEEWAFMLMPVERIIGRRVFYKDGTSETVELDREFYVLLRGERGNSEENIKSL